MILFILKNWRITLAIIGTFAALGLGWWIYDAIGDKRETALKIEGFKETEKQREKLDEIRNAPIDNIYVINRLRKGEF